MTAADSETRGAHAPMLSSSRAKKSEHTQEVWCAVPLMAASRCQGDNNPQKHNGSIGALTRGSTAMAMTTAMTVAHTRQRFVVNSFQKKIFPNEDADDVNTLTLTKEQTRIKRQCQYASKFLLFAVPSITVAPWYYNLHSNCSLAERVILYLTSFLYAIVLKVIPYSCEEFRNETSNATAKAHDENLVMDMETKTYSDNEGGVEFVVPADRTIQKQQQPIISVGDMIVRNRTRTILAILLINLIAMTSMNHTHELEHAHSHTTTATATVIALQLLCWLLLLDVRLRDPSLLSHFVLIGWILGTVFYAGCAGVDLRTGENSNDSIAIDVGVIMEYCHGIFFFTCLGMVCKIVGGLLCLHHEATRAS